MTECSHRSSPRPLPARALSAHRREAARGTAIPRVGFFAAILSLALFAPSAQANGRFPSSQYVVVGAGRRDDLIAVRTTFGLVVSDDGGRRFRFLCEEAFEYRDGVDPSLAWSARGALLVGVEDGLMASATLCDPMRRRDLDGQYVADLTTDPTGAVVLAALRSRDIVPAMRVARSTNGGDTFEVSRDAIASMAPLTVDLAPSNAMRAYATGLADPNATRAPAMLRSDDGGLTWTRTRAVFPGVLDVYVAGVDPTRADRVYVRGRQRGSDDGGLENGSALYVSDDGAESFRELARTVGPMAGFALSDDGSRVWIGGPDARDGLQISEGGGAFRTVSRDGVQCLRWHAGALYLCDVLGAGGAVLSLARGDGSTREPLVRVEGILPPPPSCAAGSVVSGFCADRWVAVRQGVFSQLRDGGVDVVSDAPRDVTVDATVAAPPPGGGCGACDVKTGTRSGALWSLVVTALAVMRNRRRRA